MANVHYSSQEVRRACGCRAEIHAVVMAVMGACSGIGAVSGPKRKPDVPTTFIVFVFCVAHTVAHAFLAINSSHEWEMMRISVCLSVCRERGQELCCRDQAIEENARM